MEKTLTTKHIKTGEFKITYLPKTFILGFVNNHDSYLYICLGPIALEWFSYKTKESK
jgi:hypothetical protein